MGQESLKYGFVGRGWQTTKMKIFFISLSFFLLYACSGEQFYHALQNREKTKCEELPQGEYEQCMENNNKSYKAYEQERESSNSH